MWDSNPNSIVELEEMTPEEFDWTAAAAAAGRAAMAAAHHHQLGSSSGGARRGRQQPMLSADVECLVCRLAASGNNFGVATCESCKTFFRRNAKREESQIRCLHYNNCNVVKEYRRSCTACRLRKCFAVGMRKELILTEEKLRTRARPTFKKPRYRWCRIPANVDINQLLAALPGAIAGVNGGLNGRFVGGSSSDSAAAAAAFRVKEEATDPLEEDDDDDDEEGDEAAEAGAVKSMSMRMAAAAAAAAPGRGGGAGGGGSSQQSSPEPSEAEDDLSPGSPSGGGPPTQFEGSPVFRRLSMCIMDYLQPYDNKCAPALLTKIFYLEDGFTSMDNPIRKMIRLIPELPLFHQLDKPLLGRIIKLKVFGALQILSALTYDPARDAWVMPLDLEGHQGPKEAVVPAREGVYGTFMGLTKRRMLDGRVLCSPSDVERIYRSLTGFYLDLRRLFAGGGGEHQWKLAALVLMALYLLEDDVPLGLADAERDTVRQIQWHYLGYLDEIAAMAAQHGGHANSSSSSSSMSSSMSGSSSSRSGYISRKALLMLVQIRWLDTCYSDAAKALQIARVPPLMQELVTYD